MKRNTPELLARKEKIRELWEAGLSGSDIGRELGCTRNTVLGHVHRLGLMTRVEPRRIPKPKTFRLNVGPKKPPYIPPPPPCAPDSLNLDMESLTSKTCRWPEGDAQSGITFCGVLPRENSPYCPFHTKSAWAGKPLHARTAGAD